MSRAAGRGLYRRDGWIFGVCGGLAHYFGFSATGLRLLTVILTFCSFGTGILLYLALALIMRREPKYWDV